MFNLRSIKEDDKGAKRARRFLAAGEGGRKIKQHGSIHNELKYIVNVGFVRGCALRPVCFLEPERPSFFIDGNGRHWNRRL